MAPPVSAAGEGILRVVRLLLDHGADVNGHVTVIEGGEIWNQGPLYGAAGIANNPELTRMLLAAGTWRSTSRSASAASWSAGA